MCVAITAVLHYLFLATFFNMLGMGLYYFMSITVTYYAMYVANNFKSKSRIHWILAGTWGKSIFNHHSFFNVWWICFKVNYYKNDFYVSYKFIIAEYKGQCITTMESYLICDIVKKKINLCWYLSKNMWGKLLNNYFDEYFNLVLPWTLFLIISILFMTQNLKKKKKW